MKDDKLQRELRAAERERREAEMDAAIEARVFGIRVRQLLELPEKTPDAAVIECLGASVSLLRTLRKL